MEFSIQYESTMNSLIGASDNSCQDSSINISNNSGYSALLTCDTRDYHYEIPTCLFRSAIRYLRNSPNAEIVARLSYNYPTKTCAGAETALRYFSRSYYTLNQVQLPKGIYYGGKGLILNSDFSPLFLSTIVGKYTEGGHVSYPEKLIVYFSPSVFKDDDAPIQKSLARKAVAYYLTREKYHLAGVGCPIEVKIDDCSKFIRKPVRPDLNTFNKTELTNLLKNNIDEILTQLTRDDNRR